MTTPYMTGTVSVTAGSAVVTGSGTAWQTALVVGGLFGLDSSNGNPVPILSVDSNTQLTLAKPWRGTTAAGQAYWIIRDTAYLQQIVTNAQALATYIQRLDNAALAALASLTPAPDKLAYFTGTGAAALTSLSAFARTLLDDPDLATVLQTLGLTKAALTDAENLYTATQQFRGASVATDGVSVVTFATERSWTVRQRGSAGSAMLSFENTTAKAVEFSSETTYTGPQIRLLPLGGTGTQIQCGGTSSTGEATPSYSFTTAPGTGLYGYSTVTLGLASGGSRCGIWNAFGAMFGARTSTSTSQNGTGTVCHSSGTFYSFLAAASNGTPLQTYLSADGTLVNGGRIASNSTGLSMPSTSDYRLKENVADLVDVSIDAADFADMSSSILRVMALRPVSFTWKDGRVPGPVNGFIAHELQQVMPHAVYGEKDAMEDVGTATKKGAVIPETVVVDVVEELQEDGTVALRKVERVIPEYVEPDEVYENTPRSLVQPDFEFKKTGEIMAPQAIDHVQIIPSLVAAAQEMTMLLLESRRTVASLNAQVATLTARIDALDGSAA